MPHELTVILGKRRSEDVLMNTNANVETKFKGMEEQLERELSSTKAIIDNSIRQNALEHDKLQNKCDSISTGINDTAVELEVANALSSVLAQVSEIGVMHTMRKIQSDTHTKLVNAGNKIVGMQETMKQHEEDQVKMKAHVEAVVGTFEQAKREEAAQWERSMRESEKFLEQEEEGVVDEDSPLSADDSDAVNDQEKFHAKVDVADVGFPVRSGSETAL